MTGQRPWYASALLAIGVNLLLYATFLSFTSPRYEDNDDWAIMSIASGTRTGEPDEHLICTNVIVGQALKHLYLTWPSIRWYTVYLLTVHFASTTILLTAFLRTRLPMVGFLVCIALFCQFQLASLLLLQFTSTAVIAGMSGMIALLAVARDRRGLPRIIMSAVGVCLMVIAVMIRQDSFYLSILLGSMALVYWLVRTWSKLLLVSLGCALLLAVAAIGYDRWVYSSTPGWSRYMRHIESRRSIELSPAKQYLAFPEQHWDEVQPVFEKIGWSKNDAKMYSNWFFMDERVYSQENLDVIVAAFGHRTMPFSEGAARIIRNGGRLSFSLAELCLNGLAAILLCRRKPHFTVLTLLGIGVASAVILGLVYQWKLPERVLVVMPYALSTLLLFTALSDDRPGQDSPGREPRHRISRREKVAVCILALLGTTGIGVGALHSDPRNRTGQGVFQRLVSKMSADIRTLDQQPILVQGAGSFPVKWAPIFSDGVACLPYRGTIRSGWGTHSPHYRANLQELSIRNVYRAIYERSDVYLVINLQNLPLLITFIKEHYGDEIVCIEVFRYPLAPLADGTISIIKAHRVDFEETQSGSPID